VVAGWSAGPPGRLSWLAALAMDSATTPAVTEARQNQRVVPAGRSKTMLES